MDPPPAARQIRPDWIRCEKSMFDRVDSYATEAMVSFPSGRIEIRNFSWSQPIESRWETGPGCFLFNQSLGNTEPASTWTHLESGTTRLFGRRGGLTLAAPRQRIATSFSPGRSRSLCLMLDAEVVAGLDGRLASLGEAVAPFDYCERVGTTEIPWLLQRMSREVRDPDFGTQAMLDLLARQIAVEIARACRSEDERGGIAMGGLAPWRLRLIRKRMAEDGPLPQLNELAAICDLTVRHLTRAFREETGQTLGRATEAAMVRRARAMLHSGAAVKDVAVSLGYSGSSAFASAFRRATGMGPGEVRPAARRRTV
jgi:AraC family transcriptional regulator